MACNDARPFGQIRQRWVLTRGIFNWGRIKWYVLYNEPEEPSSTDFVPSVLHVVTALALLNEDSLSSKHRCWCDARQVTNEFARPLPDVRSKMFSWQVPGLGEPWYLPKFFFGSDFGVEQRRVVCVQNSSNSRPLRT